MLQHKFVIVSSSSGDWEGLYKDGVLVTEGHSISNRDIFANLGVSVQEKEAAEGWLEERGNLPKNLSDVEFA